MAQSDLIPEPVWRSLRIYAFDPGLSAQFDTAGIGEITINIPWEQNLLAGPVGEASTADWQRFLSRTSGDRLYFDYTVTTLASLEL